MVYPKTVGMAVFIKTTARVIAWKEQSQFKFTENIVSCATNSLLFYDEIGGSKIKI
jgi:hypothetical protein